MKLCKNRKNCLAKAICAINLEFGGYNCKQFHKAVEEKFPSPNSDYAAALKQLCDIATIYCPGDNVPHLEGILRRLNLAWRDIA
jgi:hypothetical protein